MKSFLLVFACLLSVVLAGSWQPWLANNPAGTPVNQVGIPTGVVANLYVQDQSGYGIVNIGVSVADGYIAWTSTNFAGDLRTVPINGKIIALEVKVCSILL